MRQEVRRETPKDTQYTAKHGLQPIQEKGPAELQTLARFKAKFQNNLQMWDLFISGVGLLILAYLAF